MLVKKRKFSHLSCVGEGALEFCTSL